MKPLACFSAYLELMRAPNCAMAAFAAVIGWFIAFSLLGGSAESVLLVFAVVFLVTGAGNALNDFFDVEIDRINRAERPLPSGRIRPGAALRFSMVLFTAGVSVSYFLGILCFVIAMLNSAILAVYASHLKRRVFLGNLSIGYLTGSTFLFGGAVFGWEGVRSVVVLFVLSTLATLSREIVKDVEDMPGDRAEGAETLPLVIGERKALYLSAFFILLAVGLSPLPYFQMLPDGKTLLGGVYLLLVAVADVFFIAGIFTFFKPSGGFSRSVFLKFAMFVALLAFVGGALFR
jgi:geranylgeranylglycerol-phosphate geranylgeranyltransferase